MIVLGLGRGNTRWRSNFPLGSHSQQLNSNRRLPCVLQGLASLTQFLYNGFLLLPPLNCHYLTPLQTLVTASTVLMFHHPWDAGRASPRFYSCFSGSVVPGRGNSALPFDTYSYSLNPDCRAQCSVQWHVQTNALDYSVLGFLRSPATVTSPSTLGPVADSVHPDV